MADIVTTAAPARKGNPTRHATGAFLLAVFFVAFHTKFAIPGIPLPYLGCGVAATLLLFFYVKTIPRPVLVFGAAIMAISAASILTAPARSFHNVTSTIYMGYSIYCSSIALCALLKLPRRMKELLFFFITATLVIGAALEVLMPGIHYLSVSFQEHINPSITYTTQLWKRDYEVSGHLRPTFFATEPALLALDISYFTILWYAFSTDPKKNFMAAAILAVAAIAGGSPSIIAGVVGVGALAANEWLAQLSVRSRADRRTFLFQLASAAIALIAIVGLLAYLEQQRIELFLAGRDLSSTLRLVFPPYVTYLTLSHYPLFGVGIGGFALISTFLFQGFGFIGASPQYLLDSNRFEQTIGSGLFELLIFFGIVWSAIYIYSIWRFHKHLSPRTTFFYLVTLVTFFSGIATVQGVYLWVVTMTFCAIRLQNDVSAPRQRRSKATIRTDDITAIQTSMRKRGDSGEYIATSKK